MKNTIKVERARNDLTQAELAKTSFDEANVELAKLTS